MKYWTTPYDGRYIREDGEIYNLQEMLKNDLNPQIIYDESIEMPKDAYQTLENMMIGSPR